MNNTILSKGKLLWVDDEIELLKPHILLLEEKGYTVETATNGEDAVAMVRDQDFALVFLDEMMAGIGGLQTLSLIKEIRPNLPVVMVTKNEDEGLMEEAIGVKINDYLTKPVNPSQIILATKKILEGKKIKEQYISRDYVQEFNEISSALLSPMAMDDWINLYNKLVYWSMEFDTHPEANLRQMLFDQIKGCNVEFSKYIEQQYSNWLEDKNRPTLSIDIVPRYVIPELEQDRSVFFIVVDCLRLDQWMVMEELLHEYYTITRDYYYSILPTATPYARNAIFSGVFPDEIEIRFPEVWKEWEDDESKRNQQEHLFLNTLLQRKKITLKPESKYIKIIDAEYSRMVEQNIQSFIQNRLTAIVVNFIDMLAHGRSDSKLLKEIAPDEYAYRSLTKTWFQHSSFFGMLKKMAQYPNVTIILTTDHGSIRSLRSAKVIGDREASTNLRYKYGRNLKCDERQALFIKNPLDFHLPKRGLTINYLIAKEDYFFVYPTDYHKYVNQYRDSFQHGGISMEEMILPVVKLQPK